MRTIARAVALLTIVFCAWVSSAAPNEFYASLLRRGISDYDAGRFEPAATSLRIAAFGLVDVLDQYETAYVYLTLASERLGRRDDAHEAAHHVVAADRIERRYASLALPQPVRAAFEEVAGKLLSAADLNALKTGAPASTPRVETRTIPAPEITPPRTTTTTTTTTTTSTTTTKPATATPAPATQPAPKKADPPKPAPVKPPVTTPAKPAPQTAPQTAPQASAPASSQTTVDVPARLAAATKALDAAQLAEARRIYRELLDVRALSRDTLLRIAEGLYRSRDFAGALMAFDKLGPLRAGEEPYHYYIAVANYESGNYAAAKREIDAALPYIEVTPDVARYRTKIEGAID